MLQPEPESGAGHDVQAGTTLFSAIKTIIVADAVMSLDNVIAIAGAAKGSLALVVFGLVVSVPIIVWGSKFVMKLMDRYPVVIVLGGALLGWIAGDMTVTDVALKDWMAAHVPGANWIGPILGALLVIAVGRWLSNRTSGKRPALVELEERPQPLPAAAPAQASTAGPVAARPLVAPGVVNRILLPIDGSENAARAVEYVIRMRQAHPAPDSMDIRLINVQGEVPADISRFIAKESLADYHRENSVNAVTGARKVLDAAGVKYSVHMLVGKPWEVISEFAAANHCDLIVMGTRGLGLHTGALLGSVSVGVAQRSSVPLLLVR
jgi:nucleotide-binding universal stress UspA family protein